MDGQVRAAAEQERGSVWAIQLGYGLAAFDTARVARDGDDARELSGPAPGQQMTLARDCLRADELTLAQIVGRTGYASPNAFAAAFRRHRGQPPESGSEPSWPGRMRPLMTAEARPIGRLIPAGSDGYGEIKSGHPPGGHL